MLEQRESRRDPWRSLRRLWRAPRRAGLSVRRRGDRTHRRRVAPSSRSPSPPPLLSPAAAEPSDPGCSPQCVYGDALSGGDRRFGHGFVNFENGSLDQLAGDIDGLSHQEQALRITSRPPKLRFESRCTCDESSFSSMPCFRHSSSSVSSTTFTISTESGSILPSPSSRASRSKQSWCAQSLRLASWHSPCSNLWSYLSYFDLRHAHHEARSVRLAREVDGRQALFGVLGE